jgi:hypothetical protein
MPDVGSRQAIEYGSYRCLRRVLQVGRVSV